MGITDEWHDVTYKKNRSKSIRLDLPSIQKMPNTGRFKSKEDDVAKISVSFYVTNFPDNCSAKDLFNYCKQYRHVVDSFIPNKRSIAGKRFGFVRFINVFNNDTLVDNLSTVWIGQNKLHANLARFARTSNFANGMDRKKESNNHPDVNAHGDRNLKYAQPSRMFPSSSVHNAGISFASAVNGVSPLSTSPALVLDD